MKRIIAIGTTVLATLLLASCMTPFGILLPGIGIDIPVAPGFNISIDMDSSLIIPSRPNDVVFTGPIIGIWETTSGPYRRIELYSNGLCRYENLRLPISSDVCWYGLSTRTKTLTLYLNKGADAQFSYKVSGSHDQFLTLSLSNDIRVDFTRVR